MASTTKIMSAMVVLDKGSDRFNEPVRISEHDVSVGGSSYFAAGETVKLGDLFKTSLIWSSNEATIAAAKYLAGSESKFVALMNSKARELGLQHTHFTNSHGYTKPPYAANHYSSARDLAIITRHALTYYPQIRETVNTPMLSVETQKRENHNRILHETVPGIPSSVVDGVKTGYIALSGKCFVGSATLNGWQLIAVVLDDPNDFKDAMNLLHYGFSRFDWKTYATERQTGITVPVARGAKRVVALGVRGVLGAPLPRLPFGGDEVDDHLVYAGPPLRAPIRQGTEVGKLELWRNGRLLAFAPAFVLDSVPVAWWVHAFTAVCLIAIVIAVLTLMGIIYGTRTKNARRRRRQFSTTRRGLDQGGARHD